MAEKQPYPTGTRFGSYGIVRTLARGGMAMLYEARHATLGKRVAIKVLQDHLAVNEVASARFEREGRAASMIRHPNVVEVFETGRHLGAPYLVMELLEGEDLATLLRSRGRLGASEAVDILVPTAAAVAAAHAAGVIHRDLKPSNVFLSLERRTSPWPKVVDFGISRVSAPGDEKGLTATEMLLGTLDYMAPEHARSPKNADQRSDQYALGVILYECLTGQKPFSGSSTYDLLHAIVTSPFAAPASLAPDLDPALDAIVMRAMARDPEARFDSVEAFARALLPFASEAVRGWWRGELDMPAGGAAPKAWSDPGDDPSKAPRAESLIGTTLPDPSNSARSAADRAVHRRTSWAAIAIALAALGSGSWWYLKGHRSQADAGPLVAAPSESSPSVEPEVALREVAEAARATELPRATDLAPQPSIAAPRASAAIPRRAPGSPSTRSLPERPAASAAPSVTAPSPPASAVERGFNGAPIVE
jgi:serine/threonine-protein kinase